MPIVILVILQMFQIKTVVDRVVIQMRFAETLADQMRMETAGRQFKQAHRELAPTKLTKTKAAALLTLMEIVVLHKVKGRTISMRISTVIVKAQ